MFVTLPRCASRCVDRCFGAGGAQALLLLRLFLGLADDRGDQEQHLATVRIAAAGGHARAHVVAIGFHRGDALGVGDDGVGVLRGELPPARRPAGLRDHRLALRRRAGVQRAAGLK